MNQLFFQITILAIATILLLGVIVLAFVVFKMRRRQERFLRGKEGKSLERVIYEQHEEIEKLVTDTQDLYKLQEKLHQTLTTAIQHIGLVRFNPFSEEGGDQSFSLALLDGKKNGFVLSSLHSRTGVRLYAKPVTTGVSAKYRLSEEESEALKLAGVDEVKKKR